MANVAKYGKPEEMEKRIEEYFKKFENPSPVLDKDGRVMLDRQGNPVYKNTMPTTAGLAFYLGFDCRGTLYDYEKKPTFTGIIKRAKLKLQEHWEALLGTKFAGGAEFWLGNINDGWQDIKEAQKSVTEVKVAAVVYVGKGAKAKKTEIPTIEAEVVKPADVSIVKRPHIASHGKKLGRPKKAKTKAKA